MKKTIVSLAASVLTMTCIKTDSLAQLTKESNGIIYQTSFTANSGPAKVDQPGGAKNYMTTDLRGMWVTPEGKTYWSSPNDEANKTGGILDQNGKFDGAFTRDGGYGRNGGSAVSCNSKYIYQSNIQHEGCYDNPNTNDFGNKRYPCGEGNWYGVRRFHIDRSKGSAKFPTGSSWDASLLKLGLTQPSNQRHYVDGANGIFATETKLFVGDFWENKVKVYDSETMAFLYEWNVDKPDEITIDKDGKIWVISKPTSTSGSIKQFTETGTYIKEISTVANPVDLAISSKNELYVADAGIDCNIKVFTNLNSTPVYSKEIGIKGGIYVSSGSFKPGQAGPMRFQLLQSIKLDKDDNLYVGQAMFGSAIIESYTPANTLRWRVYGISFVNNSAIDPITERSYSNLNYENMDYSKFNGNEASYGGTTIDPFKYPEDRRLQNYTYAVLKVIVKNNIKYLYMSDPSGESMLVYKITSGSEIAKPFAEIIRSASNTTSTGAIWQDANDNGTRDAGETVENNNFWSACYAWYVDDEGSIWHANTRDWVVKFTLTAAGYSYNSSIKTNLPSDMSGKINTGMCRMIYEKSTDALYLFGFFDGGYEQIPNEADGTTAGRGVRKYTSWSTNPTLAWTKALPYQYANRSPLPPLAIKAVDIAGDYLFYTEVFAETFYQQKTFVMDKKSGDQVAFFEPDINIVGNKTGWVDHSFGISAHQRANGEYILLVEDDGYNKSVMYRFNPLPTLAIENTTSTNEQASIIVYPNPAKTTLMVSDSNSELKAENISVFDVYGRLQAIQSRKIGQGQVQIDLESLSKGTYILKSFINGIATSSKFVLE